jgi:phosphate starvation-inducible PhoH-like protein
MKKNKKTKRDTSPQIPQKSKIKNELSIIHRELNEKQKEFLKIALDKNTKLVFISGPAGSSKTFISVLAALELMNQKKVSDLIYLRSAVESSDNKLGFLPGEADEKMAPYIEPLLDKLNELLPKSDVDGLKKDGRISSVPIGFLRGLNWNAKVIIADECQNMTQKELITLLTRTGEFSKVFIVGDPDQPDIGNKSGFEKIKNIFGEEEDKKNGIYMFSFNEDDIVRSELVKYIIKKIKNIKNT